jgi:hypothetical protein
MTVETSTAPATPEAANLRTARKEQAAKKPAAKKAPAKAPAKAAATTSTSLRWVRDDDNKPGSAQHAVAADGTIYAIVIAGDKFNATKTKGKTVTVLAENVSNGAAYSACVKAAKAVAK